MFCQANYWHIVKRETRKEMPMKKIYCILGATSDIGMAYLKKINQKKEASTVIAVHFGGKEELESLKQELKNITMNLVECNLANPEDVSKAIGCIKENYGTPTHFLHLAARKFEYVKFPKLNWENTLTDLEIQVHSFAEFMKAFLPELAKQKYGRVVAMLSSVTKGVPPKYLSSYVMVKYALMGLVNSLVSEYKEKGITINCVSPTMVETRFLSDIDERLIEMTAANSGMKRNVKIEEVVGAIDYLMSDEAEYINGLNLPLTGGDIL